MSAPWNFVRYLALARPLLRRGRLPALLLAVSRKAGPPGGRFKGVMADLKLLQGLCTAWWRGEYRAVSRQALLAVVAALLYFVTPLDAIPDWLPGIGMLDDLAVLAWVMRTWQGELAAFRAWRDAQPVQAQTALERLPVAERVDPPAF